MKLDPTRLDELTADCRTPEDLAKLYSQMLQRMLDRGLQAEMDVHMAGADRQADAPLNRRSSKTLKCTFGEVGSTRRATGRARSSCSW